MPVSQDTLRMVNIIVAILLIFDHLAVPQRVVHDLSTTGTTHDSSAQNGVVLALWVGVLVTSAVD